MKRLLITVVSVVILVTGGLFASADRADVNVIPGGVCSWTDLVDTTFYVSVVGSYDKIEVRAGPEIIKTRPVVANPIHQVLPVTLTLKNVGTIQGKVGSGNAGDKTWWDLGYFPLWVILSKTEADGSTTSQTSIRHVMVNAAFPCLKR